MTLGDLHFIELLPSFMRDDPAVQGLAAGVDQLIRSAVPTIENLTVWGRIDQLPEDDLDELAQEMNLLWYDRNASIEVKRQIIRDGYATWQALGTKWAVENTIQAYFGDGNVEEWWEYGGEPGHFRVTSANPSLNAEKFNEFLGILDKVKRASAKLDAVVISLVSDMPIYAGVAVHETSWEHYIVSDASVTGY